MNPSDSTPVLPPPSPHLRTASLPELDEADDVSWDIPPSQGGSAINADGDPSTIMQPTELSILGPSSLFEQDPSSSTTNPTTPTTSHQLQSSLEAFQDSYADHRPLLSPLEPISNLRTEYSSNPNPTFVKQIDWLIQSGFSGIRRTRGDGDCFYRSLAFAYIETLLHSVDPILPVTKSLSTLQSTLPILQAVGFEEMVYEGFYDVFYELVESIVVERALISESLSGVGGGGVKTLTSERLLIELQDPQVSNSIVMFLRLLTSAELRLNKEEYVAFLLSEDGEVVDVPTFCASQVDPCGKEADHVQILALARALKINLDVAYLDGRQPTSSSSSSQNAFQEQHAIEGTGTIEGEGRETIPVEVHQIRCAEEGDEQVWVRLLYRPGHYDILDERKEESSSME